MHRRVSIVATGINQAYSGVAVSAEHVYWYSSETIWRVEK
jgi:hypothetical protein